jgi:hypothetical protein
MDMRTTAMPSESKTQDLGIPSGWNSERSSLTRYTYICAVMISSLVQDRCLI